MRQMNENCNLGGRNETLLRRWRGVCLHLVFARSFVRSSAAVAAAPCKAFHGREMSRDFLELVWYFVGCVLVC